MIRWKRYYWSRKKFNTRTGLYKGEKHYHTDGCVTDWKGRTMTKVPKA